MTERELGQISTEPPRMACKLLLLFLVQSAVFKPVTSQQVCGRPDLGANIVVNDLQKFFQCGTILFLSCEKGYSPVSGPTTIVCSNRGVWTMTRFKCILKRCPAPDQPPNGDMIYEDNVYQSKINYTCNHGYIMHGVSSIECLDNGTWSAPAPECKPEKCGLAPIPHYGMIIYDKIVTGNTTNYGTGGTYTCKPPFVLIGNTRGECTANGIWTKPPECRYVTCPPPQPIENGYMSDTLQRYYDFMETIKYGCKENYLIEGNLEIMCQKTGEWSPRPECKAPCTLDIQRGRILYNGRKLWIRNWSPNRVYHGEIISVYCMDEVRTCGYAVQTQCIDGKLKIPECFEEPSKLQYYLNPSSLPSETKQC